ncbi:ABC transporter substrate-binding protein [Nocardia sp. 2]|uniref:non-specific serine/threonine protein kinase n=1 Tax=Nocardia acididurans TaxID=2802282 RepID=A0ABS1M1C6_9NOCA|nr:bifunctional serine/threonine-protein kinase/ABC transporter substrate-binding protein [Nocardia acididurans]MBL1074339.1 ABC transporter substrate-binding protein [Nocardia acididurans]
MLCAGEVFAEYVIERWLGSGGMGEVYLARHPRLARVVAVKVLSREFGADAGVRSWFEQEADRVAPLDHPNIVPVVDRGVEGDRLWIAAQFIEGVDASTVDCTVLPPAGAVHIVSEAAKALDYAHSMGVLHWDVKPANIMLARPSPGYGARIMVADFGIGRLRGGTEDLTRAGAPTVSVAFASPEQLSSGRADRRSDQYSLACTLFWLLCGSTPFESENAAEIVAGHLRLPPPSAHERRATVPRALDAVLARAMAKNPDERFTSCAEFADTATRALLSAGFTAPPRPGADGVKKGVPQSNSARKPRARGSAARSSARQGRWDRRKAGVIGVVVTLTAVLGIVWLTRGSESPDTAAPRTSTAPSNSATSAPATEVAAAYGGFQPLAQLDGQGNVITGATPGPYPPLVSGATCAPATIAMAGALSGTDEALGRNVFGGLRLAVEHFAKANPACPVTIREFDTTGSAEVAAQLVPQIIQDTSIVALIGPVFSAETASAGAYLSEAGLPFLTPSASNPALSQSGWRGFFRGLAGYNAQAPAVSGYLTGTVGYHRVCVLSDDTEYGLSLASAVTAGLASAADVSCSATIPLGADSATAIANISASAPDAVYYSGSYTEAAPLLLALRRAGVTAPFFSGDGAHDPAFATAVGAAGRDSILSCPCAPIPSAFRGDYEALLARPPGVYSVEAYDLATIVLSGIASGHATRPDLLAYLQRYRGEGLARPYSWTETGELTDPRIWLYRVG